MTTRILLLVFWASVFLLGSEWLFFATKPSVLSALSPAQRGLVLLRAPLPLALVCGAAALALGWAVRPARGGAAWRAWLPASVPAAIVTGAEFLLVDNFSYTLFGFGVVSTRGFARLLYAIPVAALFAFNVRMLGRWLCAEHWLGGRERRAAVVTAGLAAIAAVALALEVNARPASGFEASGVARGRDLANVLVFSMDGVNAAQMSAYGSERETTPTLAAMVPNALVFENHFSNAATTSGAVGALHTGKLPTTTRVIYRPDIFQGADMYQHLPGLLRSNGYSTGDFTIRHFGDARDLNLREGFERSGDRRHERVRALLPGWAQRLLPTTSTFLVASHDRLISRLLHAFGLREFPSVYEEVAPSDDKWRADRKRVDALADFIRTADRPFFAHIHLLSTHGPKFFSDRRVFASPGGSGPWRRAAHDDAILQVDRYLAEIWELLVAEELSERTLLIVNADHGYRWSTLAPVPLVMRFPGAARAGVRTENSQRIDIAPTILDFLAIPRPGWMEGRSLLSDALDRLAPIVTVQQRRTVREEGWRVVPMPAPPFYTLGKLFVTYCNVQYRLVVTNGRLRRDLVRAHTAPCAAERVPGPAEARRFLIDHLVRAGYDARTLE